MLTLASCFLLSAQAAPIEVAEGEDLFALLADLQPGDEVIVSEGVFSSQSSSGSWYQELEFHGTEAQPIIVRAAEGASVRIEGDPGGSQNIINISGEYYTWAGFEMVYGSHGVRVGESAHAVFEDLHIHDTGDVGFSCNRTGESYEDLTIRGNEIHDTNGTGECFYLGCNDDGCQMWDSLVESNYCHDTLEASQGDGIELKTGSYNVVVRNNVIHDVKYPGITMYGTRGRGINTVEGNAVWNTGDNGIQVVGDAIVRNNLVMDVTWYGIYSKSSQEETPANLVISHNTVINGSGTCFRSNDWNEGGASEIVVANNAFLCDGGTAIRLGDGAGPAVFAQNAVLGADDAESGSFSVELSAVMDVDGRDLYPSEGSALIDAGDASFGAEEDYNCLPRQDGSVDVGAYEWSAAANPAGALNEDFKTCLVSGGGDTADTGFGGSGGGDDTGGAGASGDGCGCATRSSPRPLGVLLLVLLIGANPARRSRSSQEGYRTRRQPAPRIMRSRPR